MDVLLDSASNAARALRQPLHPICCGPASECAGVAACNNISSALLRAIAARSASATPLPPPLVAPWRPVTGVCGVWAGAPPVATRRQLLAGALSLTRDYCECLAPRHLRQQVLVAPSWGRATGRVCGGVRPGRREAPMRRGRRGPTPSRASASPGDQVDSEPQLGTRM